MDFLAFWLAKNLDNLYKDVQLALVKSKLQKIRFEKVIK